jgi:hypothetical protein
MAGWAVDRPEIAPDHLVQAVLAPFAVAPLDAG